MEALSDLAPIAQLGAAGVLLAVVFFLIRAVVRGDFAPRRELDYLRADRDARIAEARQEAADWRAAHETSEKARELLNDQNRDLIAGFRTLEYFLDSLRGWLAEGGRDVG